ncbi:MAG: Hsp20 family protein [Nitrospiraceae bacterium]|nr:Hsp20 family protein [Nitrospiraceae bacterium]
MSERTVAKREESAVADTRDEERTVAPVVDIFEVADGLAVVADLPGVEKDAVDVQVDDSVLTISAKTAGGRPGEEVYSEYAPADYFRQFRLSEHVDQEKIHAEMKLGVLTVHLPKVEKSKPKRIAIQMAS